MLREMRLTLGGLFLVLLATPVWAQPGGQGDPNARPDFAQMRQQMLDQMKEMLGTTDEEWKALQPLVEKVQQLQRDVSSRMRGPGGPGGNPQTDPTRSQSAVQQKRAELQTALDNPSATPEELRARVTALRDARAQATAELTKAQTQLRELLTLRQESVLVLLGMFE